MAHRWRFFRAGGFDQVRLDRGEDIAALGELDPKLWMALSCPTRNVEANAHTLELLDTDKDGRIRVPEVIAAAKWACAMLKDPNALSSSNPELPLESINTSTPEGAQLLSSAKEVLKNLGKANATAVSPADTTDTVKIFAKTTFNGDGIIPPESAAGDAVTEQAIRDIMSCRGPSKDLSGLDGIDKAKIDSFFTDAAAFVEWWSAGEKDPVIFPLKGATPDAYAAFIAVEEKINDYFLRCGLATMDARAAVALNPPDTEYVALATMSLNDHASKVSALPIAHIDAGGVLPLEGAVNPAWAAALDTFRKALASDHKTLTADEWKKIVATMSPHEAWEAKRPGGSVAALGAPRLKELITSDARAKIEALLAKDLALAPELASITSVDRLAHYHRDLHAFLNNFVAFKDFYARRSHAMFQAGTLYLDGRACHLTMRVDDATKHATLAGLSMIYLAYCDLTRKGSTEKMHIVAAFTAGDSDLLMVGRNGVFYDRKGQDWDATIVKVVDQPISVRQAFWSPYKKGARFISEQITKFAGDKDKESDAGIQGAVGQVGQSAKKEPEFDVARFAGIFAALGLALGAIGSAAVALATGFISLKGWQMPLAVAGLMLTISGPSMLLAAMKLRLRNLGPLLDASGWAVNGRAHISIAFGGALTHTATLPPGSERALRDPYADKSRAWLWWLLFFFCVAGGLFAWHEGYLEKLGDAIKPPAKVEAPPAPAPAPAKP